MIPMRVLLVEDEHKISTYVKRGLEEQGYAVDVAYTGTEALEWVNTVDFDLIILDILLPELDGLAVCREVRRRTIQTPILMLTARDSVDDRVSGLDAGADDYLVKPFAFRELLASDDPAFSVSFSIFHLGSSRSVDGYAGSSSAARNQVD
jgi:DNA-binding response OmpR family regulator